MRRVYITFVRKRLQEQKDNCMGRRIKRSQIREKKLHSNKFMRTADVMTGFFEHKDSKATGSQ